MALQKQNMFVNFGQGIDTKTDSKLVVPGKLLELENGVFTKYGAINKRNGYNVFGKTIEGTVSDIEIGSALGVYNNELNLYSGTDLYTYVSSTDRWLNKGSVISVIAESQSIVRNSYIQSNISTNSIQNLTAFAWEDSRGGVRYSLLDQDTGANIVTDLVLDAAGSKPKVMAFGTQNLVIFYYVAGTTSIRYRNITLAAPTIAAPAVTVTNGVKGANPFYDVHATGDRLFVALNHASAKIQVQIIESNFTLGATADILGEAADFCIDASSDSVSNIWVSYYNGTAVKTFAFPYSLSVAILAPTVVETIATPINNIIAIPRGTNPAITTTLYYEVSAALTYNRFIKTNTITLAGVVGAASVFKRSVGIASKPFENLGTHFFNTIYQSALQSTYFTLNTAGNVAAKLNAATAGTLITNATPSYVPVLSSGVFIFGNQLKGAIDSENNTTYAPLGVNSTKLSFTSENRFQNAQLGALHIVGGVLQSYDGVSAVEHGFHLFPENVTATTANSGGGIAAGTYQYSVCYEWTDNLGQIQRSAPSIPTSLVVATGTTITKTGASITLGSKVITGLNNTTTLYVGQIVANANIPVGSVITSIDSGTQITISQNATGTAAAQSITSVATSQNTLTIPTLRITAKTGARTDVRCVVYRTEANGSIFRRVSSISAPTFNSVTADTVAFVDNIPDYSSLFNDTLYTTGGVLENIAPPASSLITTWKSRVVISGLEDKLLFWYSKQQQEGSPIEFTDFFTGKVDARGGDITALGVIDGNLIIFKKSSIYALAGEGPNDTGTSNDLGQPQLITTDVGCDNPNSVVITPNGLMFKSTKGIYLLDRGLKASYIGAPVEAFNDKLITSSALVPNTNQVRFTTNNQLTLVYDYFFDQWSTFTNQTSEDCAIFNDRFVFLRANGEVWSETVGEYLDNASPIKLKCTTAWMSLAGVQGFERLYRMIVLGEYKTPHQLLVGIGYDYNPNMTQFATINVNSVYDMTTYGESSPYGNQSPYGGEYPLYQFKTHMTQQKCQTVRFSFQDNQNADIGAFGEGFSITNIGLEVGVKGTLRKMAAKNSFGTSS